MYQATFQLTPYAESFPPLLENIEDPPKLLFGRGQPLDPHDPYFAIVGTRRPSLYGKSMAEKFSAELAQRGFVIVSGLAFGIDEIAHKTALEAGGRTIAVLGSGFGGITARQQALAQEIENTGTVLTEYAQEIHGTVFTYPERNRIIAGMSVATLVVEAPERSGALITARLALEYNRAVFAVPANITQEASRGGNQFIRDCKAHPVTCVQDIFDYLELAMPCNAQQERTLPPMRNGHALSDDEELIYGLLKESSRTADQLAEETGFHVSRLNTILTFLEIKGYITLMGSYAFITR